MHVGAWVTFYRRFFLQWVDRAKAIPKVRSSIENNVVGKSPKFFFNCRGDLMTAKYSRDEGGAGGVRYDH